MDYMTSNNEVVNQKKTIICISDSENEEMEVTESVQFEREKERPYLVPEDH